jgi:phospholipid transport system substrate-binding protein
MLARVAPDIDKVGSSRDTLWITLGDRAVPENRPQPRHIVGPMPNRRIFLVFAAALMLAGLFQQPAQAAREADDFIREMGEKAINSLTGATLSEKERADRFREILDKSFDMPTIARFTLGRYWRVATKEQKDEYVKLFEDFVIQAYAARFKEYRNEGFKVGDVREIGDGQKLVASQIIREGQPPVAVQWRVRGNSAYKIIDVMVEGISMSVTQRDEFAAVISSNGGKVEGLLSALRKKTAAK